MLTALQSQGFILVVLKEFILSSLSKILVVDDSAPLHQIYQITLVRYKCPVLKALNGQNGLTLLTQNPDINLLIVDMHMPRMNGLEFIKRVKEQETFKNIPIIAIISKGQEEMWREALQIAEGLLIKPFTSTEIHAAVGNLMPQAVPVSET
jgi:CheY-like chemotaxis protein